MPTVAKTLSNFSDNSTQVFDVEKQQPRYLNPDGSSVYYDETGLPYISTMSEYSESNQSISDMTKLWAICWEKPRNTYYASSINDRISDAQYWYDKFHGSTPPEPPTTHKMALWMYLRKV